MLLYALFLIHPAGLVVNMHYGLVSRVLPTTTGIIVSVLSRCLSQVIEQVMAANKSNEGTDQEPMDDAEEKSESNKPAEMIKQATKLTQNVGHVIDAQICALEILANICTNDGKFT